MIQKKIDKLYSDFIAKRTYARWIEEAKKRESWEGSVGRYFNYTDSHVPDSLKDEWNNAQRLVTFKEVMPSMRGLWSAGPALEENNLALYNCAYIAMDEKEKFAEMLYILMHGTGVGFSVERQFIGLLPEVPTLVEADVCLIIEDSKLGWKAAYDNCILNLYSGYIPNFDYSEIRPKGARLKTFGGRASGHEPLKQLIEYTIRIFKNAQGRKLNSLEVHDLCCMIANCVVVGGVRRSACISFSNLSDQRLKHAKDGMFWQENPQRSMANNSIAYTEKPDSAIFMEEWLNLLRSGSGERGIFNTEAARRKANKMGRMEGEVRANPCFTGNMRLLTESGYKSFYELEGQTNIKIKAIDGTITEGKVWCSGVKDTVAVSYRNPDYATITCTPDHVFMLADGTECEAKDLKGKRSKVFYKMKTYFDRIPFMAGFIQGDGNTGRLNSLTHKGMEVFIGVKDLDVAKLLNAEVVGTKWYSVEAKDIAEYYNLSAESLPTRDFPNYTWKSKEELLNFLSGLWSANGCVIKGKRVSFKATNKNLVLYLQELLNKELKISSYITTNKVKEVKFSNGTYECKESYDLNIGKHKDIITFAENISFAQEYKRIDLDTLITLKSPIVSSVTANGISKVFDFTEPKFHWGVVEGVIVHNCVEALLLDRQLCNLTETVVRPTDNVDTLKEKIRAAVLIGCVQATYTNFPNVSPKWKDNCEAERLIGVSLTGTCDSPLLRKVNDSTRELLASLKEYAYECAKEFAKELGINVPKQITLTKPSGTVSQLVNCASGLHPRYADYYIRRVRVNVKDPIARLLKDKGVPCNPEVGQTWEECNTIVFDFPMKSPRGSINRHMWTAIEQLEYWKMFNQYWCDGNPSVTIYVKEDEWVGVGAWVYQNWSQVCGLSFLPYDGGNYQLAPYEEVTAEKYHEATRLFSKLNIDLDSELDQYEQDDNTEGAKTYACVGGVCEI